jgi:hypothetical protein
MYIQLIRDYCNLIKLGGSLGNVEQKLKKKTCNKNLIYFGPLVHFQE